MNRPTPALQVALAALMFIPSLAGCLDAGPPETAVRQDSVPPDLPPQLLGGEPAVGSGLYLKEPSFPLYGDTIQRSREFEVATDPNDPDRMAAMWMTMRSELGWVAMGWSHDGGETWQVEHLCGYLLGAAEAESPADLATCPFTGAWYFGDPVLMFLDDGTLLATLIWITGESLYMLAARFEDDSSMPTEVNIVARSARDEFEGAHMVPGPYRVYYNDKEQIDVDPETGRIYFGWCGMYRAGNPGNTVIGTRAYPWLSWSDDGGRTWATPTPVMAPWLETIDDDINGESPGFNVNVWPVVTRDGNVHVIWLNAKDGADLMMATSTDDGASFGEPRLLNATGQFNSPIMGGKSLQSVAIDRTGGPRDGWLYVTFVGEHHGDQDAFIIVSEDHGQTWRDPVRINDDEIGNGAQQLLPEVAVRRDGDIGVMWLDPRGLEDERAYRPYFGVSQDGGTTWTNFEITNETSSTARMGAHRPAYNPGEFENLGDYNGIAPTQDGFIAMWQDMREYTTGYVARLVVPE